MVTKKKKIPKTDPKKLMALVVDESLLENKKKRMKIKILKKK